MARLIRKTAKVSGSGGGKINVRGREWTKEDLRELKNHSREKTPAKTIAKLTKRTVGALRQKAFILGLPLGRSSREWTKEDLRELKRYARQKPPATTIAKSMKRTVAAVKRKAITLRLSLGRPVRKWMPAQPVDATQALNLSAGVSNAMVLRGRSFSWRATLFR